MPTGFVGQAWVQITPSFAGFQKVVTDEMGKVVGQVAPRIPPVPIPVTIVPPKGNDLRTLGLQVQQALVSAIIKDLTDRIGKSVGDAVVKAFRGKTLSTAF